jgi:hypothetical protein
MVGQSLAWAQGNGASKLQIAQTTAPAAAPAAPSGKSFWDNVLDVINPLEHLPVVGAIYRNITGDKPGDLEKIAGDTLYGGPIGLASSVADVAFEKITGKDFEDTVLGLFQGGDKTTATAATSGAKPLNALPARTTLATALPATLAPISLAPASSAATSIAKPATPADAKQADATTADANTQALMASIGQSGVDSDLGMRALFAYQKSMGLSPEAPSGPAAAP